MQLTKVAFPIALFVFIQALQPSEALSCGSASPGQRSDVVDFQSTPSHAHLAFSPQNQVKVNPAPYDDCKNDPLLQSEEEQVSCAYSLMDHEDYLGALMYLRKVAKETETSGESKPQIHFLLGMMNEKGMGLGEPNFKQARAYYQRSAEQGYFEAEIKIALMEANRRGVSVPNYALAIETFERGVAKNDTASLVYLGEMCEKNLVQGKDVLDAIEYYQQAEAQGSLDAIINLALLEKDGKGLRKNPANATKRLVEAASKGSAKAALIIRREIDSDHTFLKKRNFALTAHFERLAKKGDPYAQYLLFAAAEHGYFGTQKSNPNTKISLLEMAARQGNAGAQFTLGSIYGVGNHGYSKNLAKRVELYKLSAQQGNAHALFSLGVLHENGDGVVRDFNIAAEYYSASAKLGYFPANKALQKIGRSQAAVQNQSNWQRDAARMGGMQVGGLVMRSVLGF